ncbi:MAG TPA: hypothetical protein ENH01_06220 [Nitrospirae bacterium]|nr:hypothetical protein [Nitrospirota bacterium]
MQKNCKDDVEGLFEEEHLILSGKANIAVNYVWGWSKAIRPDTTDSPGIIRSVRLDSEKIQ